MKKALSLILAIMMLVSAIPAAYATTAHTNGTQVEYNAEADNDGDGQPDNVESYTVTVPAKLAPGDAGDVTAKGTWASDRKLIVTADEDVTLTNSINSNDQKVLDVEFPGIGLVGSNTAAVSDTKEVSVGDIAAALFGTWSGVFEYQVEMVDNIELPTFTVKEAFWSNGGFSDQVIATHTFQYENGMTWQQFVESKYNTAGFYIEEWTDSWEDDEGNPQETTCYSLWAWNSHDICPNGESFDPADHTDLIDGTVEYWVVHECVDNDDNIYCDVCGHGCFDNDNDHYCDDCGEHCSNCIDSDKNHRCDICSRLMSSCEDYDGDYYCDICGADTCGCYDDDHDGECDSCGREYNY